MSFISMEFFFLVVFTMILYYIPLFQKLQVFILVIASLIFYGWDQYRLIPLLMFTVFVTYFSMCGAIRGSKVFVTVGIISNLLILFFFKYKFLIFPSIADLLTDSDTVNFLLHLPLPIGISFFVFHNISLIVDSFKSGQYRDRPSAMQLVLYIIFFPQLVSGPITKASRFMPQIEPKFIYNVPWVQVGKLLITGLFFKLFCANNLAQATALMAPGFSSGLGGGDKLFMLFVYSFQIYADFFGYSTLALGLALLFGYRLPVNFQLPYIATSFSDFWNRWHISLSKWLKHYLYIPLGGNRISASRTYLHLLTVMVLGGLWHGAALSFAVWGFAHGALLAVERFVEQIIQRYFSKYHFNLAVKITYSVFVFVCVSICWLLFRFQNFTDTTRYFWSVFDNPLQFKLGTAWYAFTFMYMVPIILQHVLVGQFIAVIRHKVLIGVFFGCLLWLALVERGLDTQFIYFQF